MSERCVMVFLACSLVTLLALFLAAAAAYLARRDHATYPAALTRAATTFTAALTLAAVITSTINNIIRG
ncbi:hypothetical protein ABT052_32520 [Streptomyces sp. NPDC002766]|uniref:hypothetical protein n=1 Tax=unclassified Streptomyces TaxID=2593676 RepID=UPI003318BF08